MKKSDGATTIKKVDMKFILFTRGMAAKMVLCITERTNDSGLSY